MHESRQRASAAVVVVLVAGCAAASGGGIQNGDQPASPSESDPRIGDASAPDRAAPVPEPDGGRPLPAPDGALRDDTRFDSPAPDARPQSPVGPSYFVAATGDDSGDGSASRPWRTIQKAANSVRPGATVHVAPGEYRSGQIVARTSGTAEARIRFVSDTRWGARIYVSPVSSYHHAWVQLGSYTDIEGFDISGDGWSGIHIRAADVRVVGNHVHDFPNLNSGGAGGILDENAKRSLISGNVIHHIGDPDSPNGLIHGIYLSAGSERATVQNNIVFRNRSAGIHCYHSAQAATISHNTVFANGNWGIIIGGAEGSYADNFVVANNIVYANRGPGIVELGTTGSSNRFLNNLVSGNRSAYSIKTSAPPQGTVTSLPMFVNDRLDGSGDYRLAPGSPAIDAGTIMGAAPTDHAGASRPYGRGFDIGAYEWRP